MDDTRQMGVVVDHCKRQALLPAYPAGGHRNTSRDDGSLFTSVAKAGRPAMRTVGPTVSSTQIRICGGTGTISQERTGRHPDGRMRTLRSAARSMTYSSLVTSHAPILGMA